MLWLWVAVIAVLAVMLAAILTALVCFFLVFYSPARKLPGEDDYPLPRGEIYEVFREQIVDWVKMVRTLPHETFSICSYDGLTLRGNYYEYKKGAPVELLFHGYRGCAERDLCGGVARCFALGRNALIIDQRAGGSSEGHVITFGIREHRDCLSWVDFAIAHFGNDAKLILTGISMGAATVMMAAGTDLPKNVVCVLADCGYTSPSEIIKKVIGDLKLSPTVFYPFIKLGARLFGRFDLEKTSPLEAMKRCRVPVIFIHGDTDAFVPFEMSQRLYDVCTAKKAFLAVPGAGHGLAFPVDQTAYLKALSDFQTPLL